MIIDPARYRAYRNGAALDDDDGDRPSLDPAKLELNLGKAHSSARRPELYCELVSGSSSTTKQKRDEIRKKLGVELSSRPELITTGEDAGGMFIALRKPAVRIPAVVELAMNVPAPARIFSRLSHYE